MAQAAHCFLRGYADVSVCQSV